MLKPSTRLQPIRHQKELPREGGPGRDVFKEQLHLPVHSDVDSTHQTVRMSTLEEPINSSTESVRIEVEKNHRKGSSQTREGSASFPLSSD